MEDFTLESAADTRFTELGKQWVKTASMTKDFRRAFTNHLSEYVHHCFEIHTAPNLKAVINEEKCQRMIFAPLEYFICAENPEVGFEKLKSFNSPSQLCGKVFKIGEPTYSCRDCGYDGTCVLCIDCFQKSVHKNHHYKMNTSGGGGFCDCGDVEAWKDGIACDIHQQREDVYVEESPFFKLPPDLIHRAISLYTAVLNYCVDLLCWEKTALLPPYLNVSCNEDSFVTMLFNDEVHTYEEVIRTLQEAIPGCTQSEAWAYANTVDREGRSTVRSGSYSHCNYSRKTIKHGTSGPSRKPLKCQVMHHKVVAHQMCAIHMLSWLNKVTNYSDGLRRVLCNVVLARSDDGRTDLLGRVLLADSSLWKGARAHAHKMFMNTMLMDPVGKKEFAIHFTKHYSKIQRDFVDDDHEHSISVSSLSVQLYTVPTLAKMLILEHDVLDVILEAFMDQLTPAVNDRETFEFQKHSPSKLKRAHYMLIDLKYILVHKPSDWSEELREKFSSFLAKFFRLLKLMQGMDMTTRKTGRHIETEPDWEAAFGLQLRMMPIMTLVYDWCFSDLLIFQTAVLESIKTLLEVRKKQTEEIVIKPLEKFGRALKLFQYDVSCLPVSVHLPVSRFLAGLLLCCDKYHLSFEKLFEFESEDDKLKLFLMEYPLRTLAMITQVHAGMWRRNGYAVVNQVFNYLNVKCRSEMYDKDVVMLQAAASFLDSDYFLIAVLDKFGLVEWSLPNFDDSKYDQEKLNQIMMIAEGMFSLLIAILGERYTPGVGKVSSDDAMRREIIHRLCLRPMTHSELIKSLPLLDNELEDEDGVDGIIASVACFKKPGVTGKGLYTLKPEYFQQYNPFFYHYSRIEQSKAEEQRRKRTKKEKGVPPPPPPEFCSPFTNVLKLLCCKTLITLMNRLLTRASRSPARAVTDLLVQQVLHLTCLALHEEKRLKDTNETRKLNFISMATSEDGQTKSLFKTLEDLRGNQHFEEHSALLEWIMKVFHEELEARQDTPEGVGAGPSGVCQTVPKCFSLEDEKARKTRLAQERRAKIMAQMSALQKAFIKENAELLASMESKDTSTDEATLVDASVDGSTEEPVVLGIQRCRNEMRSPRYATEPCILCQDQQEVNIDGRAVVVACFVQRSTVLSRSRGKMFDKGEEVDPLYTPADQFWGVHVSSCGHMMHSDCWQGFYSSVVARERRALRLRQFISVDIARREFLCPLCGCISNTVLPVMPSLLNGQGKHAAEETTVQEFLSSMQDVVSSKLNLFSEEDEKKDKKGGSPIPDRFQAVFQTLVKTGTKFSDNLKEMMKVFSQSCFTVGLGVDPNEEDKRVPVLVWRVCSYTIQSGESALRAEGKPLFSGLTARQSQCMGAITRQAALVSGIFPYKTIQSHCLRLLSVLTPDAVPGTEGPSLLELDLFSVMVNLRLSIPSLLYQEAEDGSSTPVLKSIVGLNSPVTIDQCVFQAALLARLVQVLLSSSPDLQTDGAGDEDQSMDHEERHQDEADRLASLWGKLRHWACVHGNAVHPMPQELLAHVRTQLLPFLRCSALFFHFVTEIPGPDGLKDPYRPSLTEELEVLCRYLSVPTDFTKLLQWNHDIRSISSSTISQTVKRWCSHEQVKKTLATAGVESLGYSVEPSHLLSIPRDYSELINEASMFTCPNSEGDDSRAPALCLICGEMLCSQSYCCQTEVQGEKVGACAAHAQKCGAGVGVFLRVRECQILLMANKNKGCFYPPPFLDIYGETDQGLRRGNPLYLCPDRYQKLQKLWLTHSVAEEVAHCLESNRNLLSIDWTNL